MRIRDRRPHKRPIDRSSSFRSPRDRRRRRRFQKKNHQRVDLWHSRTS